MIDVKKLFEEQCEIWHIPYEEFSSVRPADDTTLFTTAGMQPFKEAFEDVSIEDQTRATSQRCLRVNDVDEVGDGTHYALFTMLGTFSFRYWSMQEAIIFWREFMQRINLDIDYVTVHPAVSEWMHLYPPEMDVRFDETNTWSDGDTAGYCTEFYHKDIEVGNIVNPLGTCIDAGFGLERLTQLVNGTEVPSRSELLTQAAEAIMEVGYTPSNTKQGYVLRKILRTLWKEGLAPTRSLSVFDDEAARQVANRARYEKMKGKFPNKDATWWFDTYGIEI